MVDIVPGNTGVYTCVVRNSAGESKKQITVNVLGRLPSIFQSIRISEPPEFIEKQYTQNAQVISGNALTLTCDVTGSPRPRIEWRKDGETVVDTSRITHDGQRLLVNDVTVGTSRYTCLVSNTAGGISRDFFVQGIAPPQIAHGEDKSIVEVMEGQTVNLDCPVVGADVDMEWMREGRIITPSQAVFTVDKTKLVLVNAQREHADVYTCKAKNSAGEATREFEVRVLVPPRLKGSLIENVDIVEGAEMKLDCEFDGVPEPQVEWSKDKGDLSARGQYLNDQKTYLLSGVQVEHGGVYRCSVSSRAGNAEKTFNVRVIEKPYMSDNDKPTTLKV